MGKLFKFNLFCVITLWLSLIQVSCFNWWEEYRNAESRDYERHCGLTQHENEAKRIVGGQRSRFGEWPWLVSIRARLNDSKSTLRHICGGSLIHQKWVLTAAHCVETFWDGAMWSSRLEDIRIRVGEHDMADDFNNHRDVAVIRTLVYPERARSPGTFDHDIALIELSNPIHLAAHVNLVCMPTAKDYVAPESTCTAAGWGHLREGADEISSIPHHVPITVISNNLCNRLYKGTFVGNVTANMLCGGHVDGGKDACQFDSGGPLVCKKNGRYVVEGIISMGEGCARREYPGIYTRVALYVRWINEIIYP